MYPTKKLSQVCTIFSGIALPELYKNSVGHGPYSFFKVGDMNNHKEIMTGSGLFFDTELAKKFKIKLFPEKTIVFPKRGGAIFTEKKRILVEPASYDSNVMGLKANNKELSDEFLFTFMKYIKLGNYADSAGIAQINNKHIDLMIIPLPPLPTQQKIVAKLDEAFANIDRQIAFIRSNIKDVENLGKSLLEDIFDNGKSSHKNLGKILTLNYGKAVDKSDKLDNGGNDVYGANGVMYKSKKYLFDGESIIVGRKGSAGAINRVSGKFWASDVTYFVTTNENIEYLYYGLMFLNLPQLAKGVKPGINRNEVYLLEIPLPSLSDQKSIVDYINGVFQKNKILTSTYESQISDLEKLKQSLLQDAFEGKLITE